jgi:hypothetical protein
VNFVNDQTKRVVDDPNRYFDEDWVSIDHAACIIWANAPTPIGKGAAVKIASKVYDGLRQKQADHARRQEPTA